MNDGEGRFAFGALNSIQLEVSPIGAELLYFERRVFAFAALRGPKPEHCESPADGMQARSA